MKSVVKKILAFALCTGMAASILTGCGGEQNNNEPKETVNEASNTGDQSQTEQQPETESGTLKLAVTTGDGSTTDDRIPTPWYNRIFSTNLMYRSLFTTDSSLTDILPDLAEKYEVSEDGLTYTITLKDGLKWSDGEALTPDDVIFSVETALKAATINSIYTAAFGKISELTADGTVITVKMSAPYADLPKVLTQFAILPKHCLEQADPLKLEADSYWTNPVTSGMYALDELNVGNYFTLKLNEHYEGEAPKIKKVINYYVSDYITAAKSGNTDYMHANAADQVEAMNEMEQFTSHEVDVLFYKYFIFNMKGIDGKENEAMQNIEVRKAIIEAVDRATLATFYPSAKVLNSGVPDSSQAYNGFTYAYDAEKAKTSIKESGYDMSRTLRICYYNNDQTSIDLINTIVYYLEQAGLTVEATLSNDGTTDLFTTREYDLGLKGKSSFSINEWYTEYMSQDALFANIFGGDTEFDGLIDELTASTDESKANEVLTKLQNLEQEKVYKVPLFTVGTYVFTSENVTLPDGVSFCNPLYSSDVNFSEWEVK